VTPVLPASERIDAPWMHQSATRAVIEALAAARPGAEPGDTVRFVGGCVRNTLMRIAVDDIDLATVLSPEAVLGALEAAGLRAVPTGLAHGTVTAIAEGRPFEITTLRRDVQTDGRHAVVAFTDDWAADARRRDFRLNAIYAAPDGVLFDPVGGIADARAGRVVFIGDADQRIAEDHLRILRFFRFTAHHGREGLDVQGLAACARGAQSVSALSVERVWKELGRLLMAPDPRAAVDAMRDTGVLAQVLPEGTDVALFGRLLAIDADTFLESHPIVRLAALIGAVETRANAVARRLRLSGEERDRLVLACGHTPRIVSFLSLREARRALWALGREGFEDRVRLGWAADPKSRTTPQWRALLAMAAGWVRPELRLRGADILAAGVAPGPSVGEVMREVEAWWIDADFTEDELSIAERLKAVAQAFT